LQIVLPWENQKENKRKRENPRGDVGFDALPAANCQWPWDPFCWLTNFGAYPFPSTPLARCLDPHALSFYMNLSPIIHLMSLFTFSSPSNFLTNIFVANRYWAMKVAVIKKIKLNQKNPNFYINDSILKYYHRLESFHLKVNIVFKKEVNVH